MNQDTICALATANGVGAIGIIRVSGKEAISVVNSVFKGKNLTKVPSHTVHYGFIVSTGMKVGKNKLGVDEAKSQLPDAKIELIDEVMVSVFKAPKTFTAEDSVEISFHGSPFIAKKILEVLTQNGARMAKAGEFTMRAFLNGRIDLSQAESIADLIASENEASRKIALQQLKGGISDEISILRNDLLNFTSLVELELDFAEEDVEFADRTALKMHLDKTINKLKSLIESFQYGNAMKNGIDVAIIGKPNAGKSTLLNTLLKEDRAIVSEIAGTTRDTIEEILHIDGTAFRFIDTAGIRETTDQIEKIGVQKAKEKINTAKILLFLYDQWDSTPNEVANSIQEFYRKDLEIILLHNKIDQVQENQKSEFDEQILAILSPIFRPKIISISAKEKTGIEGLKTELVEYVHKISTQENTIITNQRHYEALNQSLMSVTRVEEAISQNLPTDLLAYELRFALEHLGEISGEYTNDEILGNIFSKFCIGK